MSPDESLKRDPLMAEELVSGTRSLSPRQAQQVGALVPETLEVSQWDQLLTKLGLTEKEALDAIIQDSDIGRSIWRFVQESFRSHFVPEDVLLALRKRQRKAAAPR